MLPQEVLQLEISVDHLPLVAIAHRVDDLLHSQRCLIGQTRRQATKTREKIVGEHKSVEDEVVSRYAPKNRLCDVCKRQLTRAHIAEELSDKQHYERAGNLILKNHMEEGSVQLCWWGARMQKTYRHCARDYLLGIQQHV